MGCDWRGGSPTPETAGLFAVLGQCTGRGMQVCWRAGSFGIRRTKATRSVHGLIEFFCLLAVHQGVQV